MANKDTLQGKWKEIKGKVKQTWGKLTDDDLAQIDGRREQLVGKLQQRYGYAKERADEEIRRFEKTFPTESTQQPTHAGRSTTPSSSRPSNPSSFENE